MTKTDSWSEKGHRVCIATHPDKPNMSGNARGRKIHLARLRNDPDKRLTMCNLLIAERLDKWHKDGTVFGGYDRKCRVCFPEEYKQTV